MTDAKIIYLDTRVLRALWKLHLKDWKEADNRRKKAKQLRDILARGRARNELRAMTSPIAVMEMIQFDQSKHYARMRLKKGDDPKDVLDDWHDLPNRWDSGDDLLERVLGNGSRDLNTWSKSTDFDLVDVWHGPWGNKGSPAEVPELLAFALRLSLTTPVDEDDCFHVAYMLRYADGILTSDGGLLKALRLTSQVRPIWKRINNIYLEVFGQAMPESPFRYFTYPGDLKQLTAWSRSP